MDGEHKAIGPDRAFETIQDLMSGLSSLLLPVVEPESGTGKRVGPTKRWFEWQGARDEYSPTETDRRRS